MSHIEPVVLFWTAAISIFTGILFGGAAAFFVGSRSVADLLRSETRTSVWRWSLTSHSFVFDRSRIRAFVHAARRRGASDALVRRAAATPIGFDPHGLVSIDLLTGPSIRRSGRGRRGPGCGCANASARRQASWTQASECLPTAGLRVPENLAVESATGDRPLGVPLYTTTWIDANYLRTSRIALVAGRIPRPALRTSAESPFRGLSEEIVINRALARPIVPDGNAVWAHRIRAVASAGFRGPRS